MGYLTGDEIYLFKHHHVLIDISEGGKVEVACSKQHARVCIRFYIGVLLNVLASLQSGDSKATAWSVILL